MQAHEPTPTWHTNARMNPEGTKAAHSHAYCWLWLSPSCCTPPPQGVTPSSDVALPDHITITQITYGSPQITQITQITRIASNTYHHHKPNRLLTARCPIERRRSRHPMLRASQAIKTIDMSNLSTGTQVHPSVRPSRAGSPETMPPPQAPTATVETMMPATTTETIDPTLTERAHEAAREAPHTEQNQLVPKITDEQLAADRRFVFDLQIVDKRLATPHAYDPTTAARHIADALQMVINELIGRGDEDAIPTHLFMTEYVKPPPSAPPNTDGYFIVSIPDLLKSYIEVALQDEFLHYAIDTQGNRYKLKYKEHVYKHAYSEQSIADDDHKWFHYIVARDTKIAMGSHFRQLQERCATVGMSIPENDTRCFKQLTYDNERGQAKYHVAYTVNWSSVPRDKQWNTYDLSALKRFSINDDVEATFESARTWFNPENMLKVFGCCNICYQSTSGPCVGHEPNPANGKRPRGPTAAEKNENAIRRIKERQEKMKAGSSSARF